MEQPLSKYTEQRVNEESGGYGHEHHGNNGNGSDAGSRASRASTAVKRKKRPTSNVKIGGHPRRAKRQTQPLQDRKSDGLGRAPPIVHDGTDGRRDAGGANNNGMGAIINVSGWQRPLSLRTRAADGRSGGKPVARALAAVKRGIDGMDGGATTCIKGGDKGRPASTSAFAQRKRSQACRDDEEHFRYRGAGAFPNLLTAVETGIDVLRDGGDSKGGPLCDDEGDTAKASASCAYDDSFPRCGGGGSSINKDVVGEQGDHDRDDDEPHRFIDCPTTGDSSEAHPLPPPVDRASLAAFDTSTSKRSPKLELSGEAITSPTLSRRPALSSLTHNRQNQASFPPGSGAAFSSPLPTRSFHEDDIEFVTKDFGDCLLSDYRTSEGSLTMTGLSFGHDTVHSNDSRFLSNSNGGPSAGGKGWGTENSATTSLKIETEDRRAGIETNSGGCAVVRSPAALPPTPASLSLPSPVQEVASWVRGL